MVMVKQGLVWIVVAVMAGMLAATIGLLVYMMVNEASNSEPVSYMLSALVTLAVWVWCLRLLRNGSRIS
jgi:flagellar basal body-associated protein FliL